MGLSLVVENLLRDGELIAFYESDEKPWKQLAAETFEFVKSHFPAGARIRRDDVAEALVSYLKVDDSLNDCLKEKKHSQKYWHRHFADLIIDRTWDDISKPKPYLTERAMAKQKNDSLHKEAMNAARRTLSSVYGKEPKPSIVKRVAAGLAASVRATQSHARTNAGA